ncbi:MAG: FtsX-like permease family protein [Sphingobacteriales bacterium]|nr:FtsX-like permease family protein [Sphingobacteriales bacterium]
MYFTFAWRYFKAKKTTNAINIIAWVTISVIAFATCCQVLVLSVFNGFEDLVKSLYSSFYTDCKIVPASGKTFVLTANQIANLKQDPAKYGDFKTGNIDSPMIVVGAGIQNAVGVNVDPALPGGELTVILPRKTLTGTDPLESISEGNVKASGVFSIQQEFDETYAITNIGFVKQQMKFDADEYSSVEIKLKDKADIIQAQRSIAALLGKGYTVKTKYEQNATLYNTMRMEKWVIYGVLTLILIIVSCTIVSALTMLVLEKRKDINVLQSMGAGKHLIQKIFLSEGLLLGLLGTLAGITMAVIICLIQIKFKLIKIEGGSFLIDYFPVKFMATDFLLVAATAASIAFLAAWFPARTAGNQYFELR